MIPTGKLIEYLDNGKFICALVTDSQPKRVHLLNQNGRELNLAESRIVHCSQSSYPTDAGRDNIIRELKSIYDNRHQLMDRIDLSEIWELVKDEPTSNFSPSFLAELNFGEDIDDDIIAALLRCIFEDKLYFKYREGLIRVHDEQQVEQIQLHLKAEKEKEKIILQGKELVTQFSTPPFKEQLTEQDLQILELLRDYYLFGNDFGDAQVAKKILSEAGLKNPHAPFHILVNAGIWDKHENIPLLKNRLPVSFSLAARQQAERILQSPVDALFEDQGRVDLTHLKPLTIDGATTLDFDDALTIEKEEENFLVGIHISDVSWYVRPGDPLFQEAMSRGTSLYLPEGQIPMLPRHLSQGVCSLIQGEIRATFSYMILLSPEAEVLRVRIKPSIIKVARRLTYEEVDTLLETDEEIKLLNSLRIKLRKKRLDHGALLLPFPDVNIFIDNHGQVNINLGKSDTPARTIVSEMMILANTEAARYVSDRCSPGLFRVQGPLKTRIVHGEDDSLFQNLKQRKQLPRGELLIEAKPHSGLGVNQYTTVTSPIRRLLDLVMQHQINSITRRQDLMFTQEMCRDFTSVITRVIGTANNVKQQRHRYWILRYLEQRKDQRLEALVVESGPKRVAMVLTDCLMELDLPAPPGQRPQPNTLVHVRVAKVDPLDNNVRFTW